MPSYIDYVLVDTQDNKIIAKEKISPEECAKRNDEARAVGEIYLQWQPAHSEFNPGPWLVVYPDRDTARKNVSERIAPHVPDVYR